MFFGRISKFVLLFTSYMAIAQSCLRHIEDRPIDPDIKPEIISMNILVNEPSGLSLSVNKDALYTVSDNTGKIYKISLQGQLIDELPFTGIDLEGIDVDDNGDIWVVEEGLQYISHLNQNGNLIEKFTSVHVNTVSSSGFEGIAKNGNTLYILIEKSPGTLIKLDIETNTWSQIPLSFAADYSGIDYDVSDNTLWIVSDESKTLNHCTIDGVLIKKQDIDVEQAEGVAIDRENNVAWIVSDQENKLYRITLKI